MRVLLIALFLLGTLTGWAQNETFAEAKKVKGVDDSYKVTAFTVDKDNTKYIGTDRGLLKISPEGIVESVISGKNIRSITLHPSMGAWVAIDPNVLYQPSSGKSIVLRDEGVVINCMDFSGSALWVGTNNGIYVVSTSNSKVTDHYTVDNSKLESNDINAIYIEKSKLKWIGTERGIARIDNTKWKVYEKDHSIKAITENVEGVWIASANEMWLIDPFNRWTPCDIDDGLGQGDVRALTTDRKGTLYILSDVLVQFDPYNDEAIEIEYDYPTEGEQAVLMVDLDDKLWIGSSTAGLMAMNFDESNLALSAFAKVTHPGCPGESSGQIELSAEGGTPPYRYAWERQEYAGPGANGLAAGEYRIMVEDEEGNNFPLKIDLIDPQPLTADVRILTPVSRKGASDGKVTVDVNGGTGNYRIVWSDNYRSLVRDNMAAGTYSAEISDDRGCTIPLTYNLEDGPVVADAKPAAAAPAAAPSAAGGANLSAVDAAALTTLSAASLSVGQTLRIEQLRFPADSSTITEDSYVVLDEIYKFLDTNEDIVIEIGGHTNGLPEHDYCDRLSTARAQSVAQYLYEKGIPVDRIGYKGYGKRKPVATNSTVDGRRKNQRVEIKIVAL